MQPGIHSIQLTQEKQLKHEQDLSPNDFIQSSRLVSAWTFMLIWVGFLLFGSKEASAGIVGKYLSTLFLVLFLYFW